MVTPSPVLSHVVNGDGPPLLLLNGGLMSYVAWEPLAPALAESTRLVRCDFRGQLLSPGNAPATMAGHADDVLQLLDVLQIGSAHVAGVSFGGLVGITLAARAPARVRSLIAISATDRVTAEIAARGTPLRQAVLAAIDGGDRGRVLDIAAATTFSAEYRRANAAALAARRQGVAMLPDAWFLGLEQLLGSLEHLDLTALAATIACPTLIVGGDADLTFPIEHSRALAAAMPTARLVVISGGSHGLVLERSAEVIDLVVNFVRDVERATPLPETR